MASGQYQQPPSEYNNQYAQPYPPQPPTNMANQGPMEFHIYADKGFLRRKGVSIMFPDKRTDAYYVEIHRKEMTVHRGGPQGPVIGTIYFHTFGGDMDITYEGGEKVNMQKEGVFSTKYGVILPAGRPSQQFYWKRSHGNSILGGGLKIEDAAGTMLAEFTKSSGMSKDGRLAILVPGLEQHFMDQIVVSFMAMEEKRRRAQQSAAAGGGAGA